MRRITSMIQAIGICLILSACNHPLSEGDDQTNSTEPQAAADTAAATLTELALQIASTPTPSATLPLIETLVSELTTSTPTVTQTVVYQIATTSLCDVAGFVDDVTIPDGTEIEANSTFTKTWRLSNDGTCTWTSDYDVVFLSGDSMSDEDSFPITSGTVSPGETIDISVELVAPEDTGNYIGYWILRNASGSTFGIGTGQYSFYVEINVVETDATSTPTTTNTPSTATTTTEPSPTASVTHESSTLTPTATVLPSTATPTHTPSPTPSATSTVTPT
jgi:hypothetical protein